MLNIFLVVMWDLNPDYLPWKSLCLILYHIRAGIHLYILETVLMMKRETIEILWLILG